MDFDEALQYLLSLGHETLTIKLGLTNTKLLLDSLHNPETSFPSVQIAGTNGKGSTAAFLDSICRQANLRTGLFTSPHLESITERIKISGVDVSREKFAHLSSAVRDAANQLVKSAAIEAPPTFFEQVTAIALIAFRDAKVELAILETGLGGRLDSTTAANADVCAITQIAFDHEEYLGNTIESIAAEKAAIIRTGSKAVIAHQTPEALNVILKHCEEVGVKPFVDGYKSTINDVSADGRCQVNFQTAGGRYEDILLGLRGRHQIENAGVAIQLAEVLGRRGFDISESSVATGIENASHPGRLEIIAGSPALLLDGAHNPAGAKALRSYLEEFGLRPLTLVFGAMRDKRLQEIAEELFPLADNLILTQVENPRSASLDTLATLAEKLKHQNIATTATSGDAIQLALQKTRSEGMICITGSLYLVGEIRNDLLPGKQNDKQPRPT